MLHKLKQYIKKLLFIFFSLLRTLKFLILNIKELKNHQFLKLYFKLNFINFMDQNNFYHNIRLNDDYYVHDLFKKAKNCIYSYDTRDPYRHVLSNLNKEFFKKEYKKIIDIGANEGLFSFHFASMFPNTKCISIEPTKVYFDRLKIFNEFFNHKNIKLLNQYANYDILEKSNDNLIIYLGMLYHQDNVELILEKLISTNSDILIESTFWPKEKFNSSYSLKTHYGLANPNPIYVKQFEDFLIKNKKKYFTIDNIKLEAGYNLKNMPNYGAYCRKYYFIYN